MWMQTGNVYVTYILNVILVILPEPPIALIVFFKVLPDPSLNKNIENILPL